MPQLSQHTATAAATASGSNLKDLRVRASTRRALSLATVDPLDSEQLLASLLPGPSPQRRDFLGSGPGVTIELDPPVKDGKARWERCMHNGCGR